MPRYLTLLRLFWSTSVAAEMEYRTNFVLACVNALGNMVGSVFIVNVLFLKMNALGGYTYAEALIVVGFFFLLEGFSNTVMRQNLSRIVTHVRDGTLDFILLKPIDSQFWLSARNCSPWGMPSIVLGLALIAYGGWRENFTPLNYLMGIPPLILGLVILYSLWFILGATAIWFVKVANLTHVLYQLLEAGRFPVTAYPAAYTFFFTFIVPVAFLTTFPAHLMIGRADLQSMMHASAPALLLLAAGIALALLGFSRWFWRFALRFYTSASS